MEITLPSVVSVKLASPKTRQCLGGHGHHRGTPNRYSLGEKPLSPQTRKHVCSIEIIFIKTTS